MLDYNPEEPAITKPFQSQALLGCILTLFVFMLIKPSEQNDPCIVLCGCDIEAQLWELHCIESKFDSNLQKQKPKINGDHF